VYFTIYTFQQKQCQIPKPPPHNHFSNIIGGKIQLIESSVQLIESFEAFGCKKDTLHKHQNSR